MGQSHLQERGMFRTGKTKQRVLSVKTPGWQHCDTCGQLHKTAPCGNRETLHYKEEAGNSSPSKYGYLDGVSLPKTVNEELNISVHQNAEGKVKNAQAALESLKKKYNICPSTIPHSVSATVT